MKPGTTMLARMPNGPSPAASPATAAASAMSASRGRARTPAFRHSAATASSSSRLTRVFSARSAPSAANASAMARPMLRLAPVMSAVFPLSLMRVVLAERGSVFLETHFLQGRRPGPGVDEHQRGLRHPPPHPARPDVFIDGPEPHPLLEQPLDLVQHRLALLPVGLPGLLLVQVVDVGAAAIGVGPVTGHDFRHPRGGVAIERAGADTQPLQ